MKKRRSIKDAVDSVRDWWAKADREREEELREVFKAPDDERTKYDHLEKRPDGWLLNLDSGAAARKGLPIPGEDEESGEQIPSSPAAPPEEPASHPKPPPPPDRVAKAQQSITPIPAVPPPRQPPELRRKPPSPRPDQPRDFDGVAGLKRRDPQGRPSGEHEIVLNEINDSVYQERKEVIDRVQERYARYGKRIASAILARTLMPKGVELLLSRLDLRPTGNLDRDHGLIIEYIEKEGIETFCHKAGIKLE